MIEFAGRRFGIMLLCGSFGLFAACTGADDQDRAEDRATASAPQPVAGPSAAAIGDTVTGAGRLRWTAARVAERLRAAGFTPEEGGTVRQPFMSVAATIYNVRDATVQVFIYGDAIAVARDTDALDSASVAPANMSVSWRMPPSLVVDNNLAAIVLTRNGDTRRRIKAALTAEGDAIREP